MLEKATHLSLSLLVYLCTHGRIAGKGAEEDSFYLPHLAWFLEEPSAEYEDDFDDRTERRK